MTPPPVDNLKLPRAFTEYSEWCYHLPDTCFERSTPRIRRTLKYCRPITHIASSWRNTKHWTGWISAWKKHTGPGSGPYHLRRKWLSKTRQNWSCLPGLDCRIRHCVAQRSVSKTIQSFTMLGRQCHWTAIGTTPIPCPHGWHQQFMEDAEEWPAPRICTSTDSLQLVHQWSASNNVQEIHLCRRHLPCPPSTQVWRSQHHHQHWHC